MFLLQWLTFFYAVVAFFSRGRRGYYVELLSRWTRVVSSSLFSEFSERSCLNENVKASFTQHSMNSLAFNFLKRLRSVRNTDTPNVATSHTKRLVGNTRTQVFMVYSHAFNLLDRIVCAFYKTSSCRPCPPESLHYCTREPPSK